MYISLNWINDYVDLAGVDVAWLVHRFTMTTAEVEGYETKGAEVSGVVAAKVLTVENHPESKKLHICQVDKGDETVQIVCGAPNVRPGMIVPLATVGAKLPGIDAIGVATLAGVTSWGMMCSEKELGISDNHSGLMEFPEDTVVGTDLHDLLPIDDTIIEIDNKSLTNRPDLWGHYGIAREVAAILNRPLRPMPLYDLESRDLSQLPKVPVSIVDKDKCYRYACIAFGNFHAKVSPVWMRIRLYYCGMRAINALVDLTNYVMMDLGQPMHAFDRNSVSEICVKSFDKDVEFVTLDDAPRTVPAGTLFICDGDKPTAIAGIKGGAESEVTEDTEAILLESASFNGGSIRRASIRLGLRTDASARYEKSLDPEYAITAIKRVLYLAMQEDPGTTIVSDLNDVNVSPLKPVRLVLDKAYIERYTGMEIDMDMVVKTLTALEFGVSLEGDTITVDVPSFRSTKDVTIKVDIIEEITRVYGYDNIQPEPLKTSVMPGVVNQVTTLENDIKTMLTDGYGMYEVNSYVWYDDNLNHSYGLQPRGSIHLIKPSSPEHSTIREVMAPSMLYAAAANVRHTDTFSIYEIGSTMRLGEDNKSIENRVLSVVTCSAASSEDQLFYRLKGLTDSMMWNFKNITLEYVKDTELGYNWLHPVKCALIKYRGETLGYITVLHPSLKQKITRRSNCAILELNVTALSKLQAVVAVYKEAARYQEVKLDFNFVVPSSTQYKTVADKISGYDSPLFKELQFVSLYRGAGIEEGCKSLTFNVTIGSNDHTLSGQEIDEYQSGLIAYMQMDGYKLR